MARTHGVAGGQARTRGRWRCRRQDARRSSCAAHEAGARRRCAHSAGFAHAAGVSECRNERPRHQVAPRSRWMDQHSRPRVDPGATSHHRARGGPRAPGCDPGRHEGPPSRLGQPGCGRASLAMADHSRGDDPRRQPERAVRRTDGHAGPSLPARLPMAPKVLWKFDTSVTWNEPMACRPGVDSARPFRGDARCTTSRTTNSGSSLNWTGG